MAPDFPWEVPPAPEDPLLGAMVGSFRIVRKLGEGGMGAVYLGEQSMIGSKVAVKFLHEHLASNTSLVQRFYAEARAVNLIGHENIVNIFDMNLLPPRRYYLVMEYLVGESLASYAQSPMPPEEAVPILAQVCDALQAAHEHGVVHRDLKPENLFVLKRKTGRPFVKVLDFGIAKLFGGDGGTEQTVAGSIVGTPEYMAPEQASGQVIDGRADLYAVGIIAYRMLTARLPFTEGGLGGILLAHQTLPPPPVERYNPEVGPELSAVLAKALAKRREDRYPDAAALKAALEGALGPPRPSSQRPAATPPAPERPPPPVPSRPEPPSQVVSPGPTGLTESVVAAVQELQAKPQVRGSVWRSGEPPQAARFVDLSKAGLYVVQDGPLPKPFSRVRVALEHPPGALTCEADVVRVVNPEQAQAWCMSPGYALQFASPPQGFQDAVAAALKGSVHVPAAPSSAAADPAADALLQKLAYRATADAYGLLSVPQDAEFPDINQRGRELKRELETLRARSLSGPQRDRLEQVARSIMTSLERITTPRARALYDAGVGNFRGVARCLSAGLTVTELEAARARFLSEHPGAESKAQIAIVSGKAWESKGKTQEALAEYERALTVDPLNLSLQQRYWGLKRKG